MFPLLERAKNLGDLLMSHGLDLIQGLIVVICGLLFIRWLLKKLRTGLERLFPGHKVGTYVNILGIVLVLVVVIVASVEAGLPIRPVLRLLIVATLIVVGVIMIFRPLVPDLPFKVGNTVKVGNLLGKVEAITFLNTRLLTFDGKPIFVPNRKILDDIVINYHFTQNRRIKINLGIHYDSDLIRAKQVLEELMIEDPRIKVTPRPVVYTMSLTPDGVQIGARCWVENKKYWVTKCDLIEKIKLCFDREGIAIAHEQMDVFVRDGKRLPGEEEPEEEPA